MAAYVVTVRHAAAPDVHGLLYPLLLRYQAGNLSSAVFTLPAIAAIINFVRAYATRACCQNMTI